MIDITPLDVRKKRGDIPKVLRGYDPEEVDNFLGLVADRLEELVKENLALKERANQLEDRVGSLQAREEAVQGALVKAQELSSQMDQQARREAGLLRREAEARIDEVMREAENLLEERKSALRALERTRQRFLKSFRTLLEREMDDLAVLEEQDGLDPGEVELELEGWKDRLADSLAAIDHAAVPDEPPEEAPPPVPEGDEQLGLEAPPAAASGPAENGSWLEQVEREADRASESAQVRMSEARPGDGRVAPRPEKAPGPGSAETTQGSSAGRGSTPETGGTSSATDRGRSAQEPTAASEGGPELRVDEAEDEGPQPWDPEYEIPRPDRGPQSPERQASHRDPEGVDGPVEEDREVDEKKTPPVPGDPLWLRDLLQDEGEETGA